MSNDLRELALDQVHDSPNQPRLGMSKEVRESVKLGIEGNNGAYPASMAITVRPRPEGGYEILAGHHRTQAARELGLPTIWAFVRELGDKDAAILQVTSNNQRGMTTIEVGKHALMMRDQHGVTVAEYARAIGKSEATVYTYIHAYLVLEQYGGLKGPFVKVPTQALSGLYGVQDTEFVSGLLYQFAQRGTTGPVAEKVIKLCKEGRPMWQAFNLAEGREEVFTPQSGSAGHAINRVAKTRASGPVAAAGVSAVATVQQNNEVIAAYEYTLALYQARCEVLEAWYGKPDSDEFTQAVAKAQALILEELRGKREQGEVPA